MQVSYLKLENFRTYKSLEIYPTQGPNLFLGANGQGKTNVVESLIYSTYLQSHRTASDTPLIHYGESQATIEIKYENINRTQNLKVYLNQEGPNQALLNNQKLKRKQEIVGNLQTVYFSPEDLDLVRKEPAERRKFIDRVLTQTNPKNLSIINDYEKALKQRNHALREQLAINIIQPFTEKVIELGAQLITNRINLIEKLQPYFQNSYLEISKDKTAKFYYESSIGEFGLDLIHNQKILEEYAQIKFYEEQRRGITLFGPHRDNLFLELNNFPALGYASHGESWSIALSLKLATFHYLKMLDIEPILILDDVFAELDDNRRKHLVEIINNTKQTFITTAVAADIPKNLNFNKFDVLNGKISNLGVYNE